MGIKNLLSCNTVADFFLLQLDQTSGDTISNLKLQKLCYYAQAWFCAVNKSQLFSDKIEAWAHGPVVPSLYNRFRKCGLGTIPTGSIVTQPLTDLHKTHIDFLEEIWSKYSHFSGTELELLTHSESPWIQAYGDRKAGSHCSEEITIKSMIEFYGNQLRN